MYPWTSEGGAFGAVEKKRDKLIKCFLKGAVSRLSRSFCKKKNSYASIFAVKLEKLPLND